MLSCPKCRSWRFYCECGMVDRDIDDGPLTILIYVCYDCGIVAQVHPVTGDILQLGAPDVPEEDRPNE